MAVGRGVPIPGCDAACHQALDSTPVKVREDGGVHAKLIQSPQEAEPLTNFLDHGVSV